MVWEYVVASHSHSNSMRRSGLSLNGKEPMYRLPGSSSAFPRPTSFRAPPQQTLLITTHHPDLPVSSSSASRASSSSFPPRDDEEDENQAPETCLPQRRRRVEHTGEEDEYDGDDEGDLGGVGDDGLHQQDSSPVKKKVKAAGSAFGYKTIAIRSCRPGGSHYEVYRTIWAGTSEYRSNKTPGRGCFMNTPDKQPFHLLEELQNFASRGVFNARVKQIIMSLDPHSPVLLAYQFNLMRQQAHQNAAARGRLALIFANDYIVVRLLGDTVNGTDKYLPGLTQSPHPYREDYFSAVSHLSHFKRALRFPARFGRWVDDTSDWKPAVIPSDLVDAIVLRERSYNGSIHLPLVEKAFALVSATPSASQVCGCFLSVNAAPTIAHAMTLLTIGMENPAMTGNFGTRRTQRNVGEVAGIPCVTNPYQLFKQWEAVLVAEFSDPDIVKFIEEHANLAPFAGVGAEPAQLGDVEQTEDVLEGIEGLFGDA